MGLIPRSLLQLDDRFVLIPRSLLRGSLSGVVRINNRSVWLYRCDRISRAFYYVIDCGCELARRNIVVEERQSCLDLLFDLTRLWDENETHRGEAAHAAGSEDRRGANSELKADLNTPI